MRFVSDQKIGIKMKNLKFVAALFRNLVAKQKERTRNQIWDEICRKDPRNPGCKMYDV